MLRAAFADLSQGGGKGGAGWCGDWGGVIGVGWCWMIGVIGVVWSGSGVGWYVVLCCVVVWRGVAWRDMVVWCGGVAWRVVVLG